MRHHQKFIKIIEAENLTVQKDTLTKDFSYLTLNQSVCKLFIIGKILL